MRADPKPEKKLLAFVRTRDRLRGEHILISEAELVEQGIEFDDIAWCGRQLLYNGIVHSVRGYGTAGILIKKLGEM